MEVRSCDKLLAAVISRVYHDQPFVVQLCTLCTLCLYEVVSIRPCVHPRISVYISGYIAEYRARYIA